MVICGRVSGPDSRGVVPAGGSWPGDGLSVNRSGDDGLVNLVVGWLGHAINRKETQDCKCQKGRDGGVHTHHDFGGADRQSTSYTTALIGRPVSDQVGSVYLSINSGTSRGTQMTANTIFAGWPRFGGSPESGGGLASGRREGPGCVLRRRVGRCGRGFAGWEA